MMARMSFMAVGPWSRATLVDADRAIPDDEPAHNILPRPQTEASHDRFFEEGEEPPARYDLVNPADYIEVNLAPITSERWRQLAVTALKREWATFFPNLIIYYLLSGIGLSLCYGYLPFLFVLVPLFRAAVVRRSLLLLTENKRRFAMPILSFPRVFELIAIHVPVAVTQASAVIGLFFILVSIHATATFTIEAIDGRTGPYYAPDFRAWYPLNVISIVLGSLLLLVLHVFLVIRCFGFTTQLLLDYDLGPIQTIRANWRITRGRTGLLTLLKLRLWFWKYLVGVMTLGFGFLLYEPYSTTVWTAAYLDIAGSEPPLEPARVRQCEVKSL